MNWSNPTNNFYIKHNTYMWLSKSNCLTVEIKVERSLQNNVFQSLSRKQTTFLTIFSKPWTLSNKRFAIILGNIYWVIFKTNKIKSLQPFYFAFNCLATNHLHLSIWDTWLVGWFQTSKCKTPKCGQSQNLRHPKLKTTPKNEDNTKNLDIPKNEKDPKNEENPKMKTTSKWRWLRTWRQPQKKKTTQNRLPQT